MNNKKVISNILFVAFQVILLITAVASTVTKEWKNLFLSILSIISLSIPFAITYFAKKRKIDLPRSFQVVVMAFIFSAQYFGEIRRLYTKFWWWDLLLHFVSGFYMVIIALYLIKGIYRHKQGSSKERFIFFNTIFAFSFSIALGTLWELFEFVGDYLFKSNMVKGGLIDTATDLLVKVLGAFIASILYHSGKFKK